MDKRILYVCEYDNYGVKFYFFRDESNGKWVGGIESKENNNSVEDFIAAAKNIWYRIIKNRYSRIRYVWHNKWRAYI